MDHQTYMARALELAAQAAQVGDVPVGCVIVRDGEIIGEGRNRREENGDATAHAELEAIRDAFREDGVSMTYNHLNVHIVDNTKEK